MGVEAEKLPVDLERYRQMMSHGRPARTRTRFFWVCRYSIPNSF